MRPGQHRHEPSMPAPGTSTLMPRRVEFNQPGKRCAQTAMIMPRSRGATVLPLRSTCEKVAGPSAARPGITVLPGERSVRGRTHWSDFKRVDEVCGMLAEKSSKLGGPWSDHLEGPVWELRIRLRDVRRGSPPGVLLMEGSCY
jgi:hypothetical protein